MHNHNFCNACIFNFIFNNVNNVKFIENYFLPKQLLLLKKNGFAKNHFFNCNSLK